MSDRAFPMMFTSVLSADGKFKVDVDLGNDGAIRFRFGSDSTYTAIYLDPKQARELVKKTSNLLEIRENTRPV